MWAGMAATTYFERCDKPILKGEDIKGCSFFDYAIVFRAAGTVIRGLVQDQFNLVSIAFYFPRYTDTLLYLDQRSNIEILTVN